MYKNINASDMYIQCVINFIYTLKVKISNEDEYIKCFFFIYLIFFVYTLLAFLFDNIKIIDSI